MMATPTISETTIPIVLFMMVTPSLDLFIPPPATAGNVRQDILQAKASAFLLRIEVIAWPIATTTRSPTRVREIGLDTKMENLPPDISSDCLMELSIMGASTKAKGRG